MKSIKEKSKSRIELYFGNHIYLLIFALLLLVLVITRFSFPETKSGFGFDQVDNAWAVKNIVIDGNLPLVGMQAKGNTGFYIGPYYYYLLVPFYVLFGMDPIASSIAAGFTAVFSFIVTYFVIRGIFNEKVALIGLFIATFSSYILELDRVQWPVNFIVPISFLIFYSLYKICMGDHKKILLLAVVFGFSLHIHFTSIFYVLLIVFATPFIPRNRNTIKYAMMSLPILLLFLAPIGIAFFQTQVGSSAAGYLGSTYHGFHLRRFIQIMGDGFIEFNSILKLPYSLYVSIFSFVAFIAFLIKKRERKDLILVYLACLWISIPWIAFSTYSGELTNYYFAITRPIAIIVFSFLIFKFLSIKNLYIKFVVYILLTIYSYNGIAFFAKLDVLGLASHRSAVLEKIERGEEIDFVHGNPQSYIYYYYTTIRDEKK